MLACGCSPTIHNQLRQMPTWQTPLRFYSASWPSFLVRLWRQCLKNVGCGGGQFQHRPTSSAHNSLAPLLLTVLPPRRVYCVLQRACYCCCHHERRLPCGLRTQLLPLWNVDGRVTQHRHIEHLQGTGSTQQPLSSIPGAHLRKLQVTVEVLCLQTSPSVVVSMPSQVPGKYRVHSVCLQRL